METHQGVCRVPANQRLSENDYGPLEQHEACLIVQLYGSQSSAQFLFQDGVNYFGLASEGVIGYAPQKGFLGTTNIVFANPVCAPSTLNSLLSAFLASQTEPTLFVGVDQTVAEALSSVGYRSNQVGVESHIEIDTFNVVGQHKKQLRHASNFAKRHRCRVDELSWQALDTKQVIRLSEEWRSNKGVSRRELKLLTKPPVFEDEPLVRKFYCFEGHKLLGFVYFEPYFESGKIKGYCANIIRSLVDAEYAGVSDYIILEAIKQFRLEGVKVLSLGLSPLYNIQPENNDNPRVRWMLRLMYQRANALYAFKGLAYHKTRYRPVQTPWYLCSKDLSTPRLFSALFFGLGVL
ncbi:DUF2156 domain-containing protein [Alkalimarinus alittae]|uniref:DUF2156 domain-containing protein n=1 Tax=Alkalimarinus alittae TaxID=2961619 RepID=A0ABY6N450_9ALTE|nr:DUF2156 domain-containing protein [Alkalimarinus alittae]UZE96780.1 DUF2156 domain-containing protein [Alkalimarinus alittae]